MAIFRFRRNDWPQSGLCYLCFSCVWHGLPVFACVLPVLSSESVNLGERNGRGMSEDGRILGPLEACSTCVLFLVYLCFACVLPVLPVFRLCYMCFILPGFYLCYLRFCMDLVIFLIIFGSRRARKNQAGRETNARPPDFLLCGEIFFGRAWFSLLIGSRTPTPPPDSLRWTS